MLIRAIDAENRALADCVGRIECGWTDGRLAADGIEGLFVLPPPDIAHKTGIIEYDALASNRRAVALVHYRKLKPIELEILWVRNHRKRPLTPT